MDSYIELLKLILPEMLVAHFDLLKHRKEAEVLHLYFEESNVIPKEEVDRDLIAYGFHKQASVQDFTLRGNTVCLHVKRRSWLDKNTKQIVQRDW